MALQASEQVILRRRSLSIRCKKQCAILFIGLITLNRPKALNALCDKLINEVVAAANDFDKNANVGAIILTGTITIVEFDLRIQYQLCFILGSEKAFAAGADIKEMSEKTYVECYINNLFENWMLLGKISKPVRIFS